MPVNKDFYMLAGSSGQSTGYTINQSIRFARASNTSGNYMQRDFGSAGDRTSWTWSCWFKLGSLNNFTPGSNLYYQFFACDNAKNDSNRGSFHIIADTSVASAIAFQFQGHSTSFIRTNRQFRDPSAWMHLVLVWDSDNAIPSERARLYINGTRETDFAGSSNPTSGQEIGINLGEIHRLGISYNISGAAVNYPFDGYMADIHFLDGYSYGPEYFGEFDDYDNWIDGRDSSDLGDDESGNGNDFSTTNFAAHDQVNDTPTNNFAVLNPLDSNSNVTQQNGNLEWTSSAADGGCRSTIFFNADNADKFYVEAIVGTYASAFSFGISNPDRSLSGDAGEDLADFYGWYINPTQNWLASGSNPWNTGSNSSSGSLHVLQMAIDVSDPTSIKLYAGINDTYYNSSGGTNGNPSTGANATATITGSEEWSIGLWNRNSAASNIFVNFGQEGTFGGNKTAGGNSDANGIGNFFHTVPTGYLALCTRNLFTG
jgi:hypothetical protein